MDGNGNGLLMVLVMEMGYGCYETSWLLAWLKIFFDFLIHWLRPSLPSLNRVCTRSSFDHLEDNYKCMF
jgi:hypothetical protein